MMSQKGFSLPEIAVALGLLGGISLITMKLVQESGNNENILKARAEIQKATVLIKNSLADPDSCRKMLKQNVVLNAGLSDIIKPSEVPATNFDGTANPNGLYQALRDGSYKRLLVANTRYNGFRTGAVRISKTTNGAPNVADLILEFRVEKKGSLFANDSDADDIIITNRIPVIYFGTVNGANDTTITDCGPVVSEANETAKQKFCASLGGMATWDSTLKTCRFQTKKCLYGEAAFGVAADGTLNCQRIDMKMDPNQLLDTSPCTTASGGLKIGVNAVGKLKILCY